MADRPTELRFVAKFAHLVLTQSEQADRFASGMLPEMLEDPKLAALYQLLCRAHASGAAADPIRLQMDAFGVAGKEVAIDVWNLADLSGGAALASDAARVLHHWQARGAATYLAELAESLKAATAEDPRKAIRLAEEGTAKASALLEQSGVSRAPRTRAEIAAAERELVLHPEKGGSLRASWPYPKLRRALGDLLPGRLVGVTAYPNQGKSTFAANLLYGFLRQNVPTIAVATEMGDDWLRRAWAAEARIPQDIAENRLWHEDDAELMRYLRERWRCSEHQVLAHLHAYRESYLRVVERFPDLPCEVVEQTPITPEQVIARLRVLRRRWPGRFVVAIVDHLHNLAYPNDEVDKHVGIATQRLREFARTDGAMAIVALYQPKKPEKGAGAEYRPIYARDIRGQVAQHLDVHLSIYRRHVLTTRDTTPWGTRACAYEPETRRPRWCSASEAHELGADGEPAGKLDDEHMYLKPDKRRIGGEGPTITLDMEADTGRVLELDPRHMLQAV